MSRDWQKDIERVENFKHVDKLCNGIRPMFHGMFEMPEPDILVLEYWLQQYAAEKERADKLREAIETAINEKAAWGDPGNALDVVTRYLADALASLYPKEETKPAVLEDDDIVKSMNAGPIPFGLEEEETK